MFLDDYRNNYKSYELSRKNIINNGQSIEKYSKFNLEVIGSILAKITTAIEGKEFIFKSNVRINDTTTDFPHERLNLIVEKEISDVSFSTQTYMSFNKGEKKLKSGKYVYRLEPFCDDSKNIFVLNKARKMTWFTGFTDYSYNFSFYSFHSTHSLELHYYKMNFQNFPYLESFIDYIIDYRIQNKKDEMSEEELMELSNQFLIWYLSENKSLAFKPISDNK